MLGKSNLSSYASSKSISGRHWHRHETVNLNGMMIRISAIVELLHDSTLLAVAIDMRSRMVGRTRFELAIPWTQTKNQSGKSPIMAACCQARPPTHVIPWSLAGGYKNSGASPSQTMRKVITSQAIAYFGYEDEPVRSRRFWIR